MFGYVVKGELPGDITDELRILEGFEAIKVAENAMQAANLISTYRLPRECVPTQFLGDKGVWEALLQDMPLTAMIRNLGKMTSIGLLGPLAQANQKVLAALGNAEAIHKARVHPMVLLAAQKVYEQGRGDKGSLSWSPVPQIVDALDAGFYLAFQNVVPTKKAHMLCCDISSSMEWGAIAGMSGITPRTGAAAMALITANVEPNYCIMGFSDQLTVLDISPKMRLADVCRKMASYPFGSTDCALPMQYALKNKIAVEAFFVYTDSETHAGRQGHPVQSLAEYRRKMNIPAKLCVVGMVANGFTIADPKDAGMLDVVGFDTSAPAVMADFVRQ